MSARARPASLTFAISRMVCTDSSRARSMKAHVLTTRQSAVSATSVISWPSRVSMPSISSESTWFLGQPRVVKWTFMTRGYDPTRHREESIGSGASLTSALRRTPPGSVGKAFQVRHEIDQLADGQTRGEVGHGRASAGVDIAGLVDDHRVRVEDRLQQICGRMMRADVGEIGSGRNGRREVLSAHPM